MKPFLWTFTAGLVLATSLIATVDPASHWFRRMQFPDQPIAPGQIWVPYSGQFDARVLRLREMDLVHPVGLVFMGSSRVMPASSRMVRVDAPVLNLGIPAPSIDDHIALWQALKERRNIPRDIVVYVDPGVLNRNVEHFSRLSVVPYLLNYDMADRPTILDQISAMLRVVDFQLDYWHHQVKESLTASEFWAAAKILVEGGWMRKVSAVMSESELAPPLTGYRNDGSLYLLRPKRDREAFKASDIPLWDERNNLTVLNWELNEYALTRFEGWLSDTDHARTEVMLVLPPYSPAAMNVYGSKSEYAIKLREFQTTVHALTRRHTHVAFCNAQDPAEIPCSPDEFLDDVHVTDSCIEKTLSYCFGSSKAWSSLINSRSVKWNAS